MEKIALLVRTLEGKAKKPMPETLRTAIEEVQDINTLDRFFDIALSARSFAAFAKQANLEVSVS